MIQRTLLSRDTLLGLELDEFLTEPGEANQVCLVGHVMLEPAHLGGEGPHIGLHSVEHSAGELFHDRDMALP